jgi:group I intron endonuclease
MDNQQPSSKGIKKLNIDIILMGIIYIATSPSGKNYVGQTMYSLEERWRDHKYDAFDPNKDHCVALNNAIRKYGHDKFIVNVLILCNDSYLDKYEEQFIDVYLSSDPKFGYNIKIGGSSGKHSDITKMKISNSLKGRIVLQSTKLKLSLTKKNNSLPMYLIEYKNDENLVGYRVCNHPMGPERKFSDSTLKMEEKYEKALEYLNYLNGLKEPLKPKNLRTLPNYVQKYKDGYCVKVPGKKIRYFLSNAISQEQRLINALEYLKQ